MEEYTPLGKGLEKVNLIITLPNTDSILEKIGT